MNISKILVVGILCTLQAFAGDYVNREAQYDADFSTALEIAYGDGHMSSGGEQTVKELFKDIDLNNKNMLDFGCGLGGPALYLAQHNAVSIVGVDIEPYVIATAYEKKKLIHNLKGVVDFQCIQPESFLPFEDNSFDIVYAGESILHVRNKALLFSEFYRIMKPGGRLLLNDWFHASSDYSQEVKDFLQADGLEFNLTTIHEYTDMLKALGFKNITTHNASQHVIDETHRIIDDLDGYLGEVIRKQYDELYLQDYLASWRLQELIFKRNEMFTYVVTADK